MPVTFTKATILHFPELYAIKTSLGSYYFRDKDAFQIMTGLDKASAKPALYKYYMKHYAEQDFPSILTSPPDSAHVCTFIKPDSGKVCRLFSLSGLEFLCNNVTGKNADENKPKFLELIRTFRASIGAAPPADENTQLIAVIQSLPVMIGQAITGPLQALMTRQAETFHEQVKGIAMMVAEKEVECEKVKHTAEMERTKFEADKELQKTKYENDAKVKDINHQIELERSKHEAEKAQWELKAAEIRQAKRDEAAAAIRKPAAVQLPENPPPVHANLKAETSCLWLALFDAEVRRDNYDFNRINTFVKACSSVLIDSDENTWVALIELERPMVLDDNGKEMRLLAKDVGGIVVVIFSDFLSDKVYRTSSPAPSSSKAARAAPPPACSQ